MHREHYSYALAAAYVVQGEMAAANDGQDVSNTARQRFVEWTLKSKGRGLIDILSKEALSDEAILQTEQQQMGHDSQDGANSPAPSSDPVSGVTGQLATVLSLERGASSSVVSVMSVSTLETLLQSFSPTVLIFDFINLTNCKPDSTIVAVVHRYNSRAVITPIHGVNMSKVVTWIEENLNQDCPLMDDDATEKLEHYHMSHCLSKQDSHSRHSRWRGTIH